MLKGLTSQLTNRVTKQALRFRGRRRANEVKSIFIIIGTIISQMSTAIGALIWLPAPNSSLRSQAISSGSEPPEDDPATMQSTTQTLR